MARPKLSYDGTWHPRWLKCRPEAARSYEVIGDIERSKIIFHPCGVESHHREDVRQRYCAFCDKFVSEQHKETL